MIVIKSFKQDRNGVRKASDIERKYNFNQIETNKKDIRNKTSFRDVETILNKESPFSYTIVSELPENGVPKTVYLVLNEDNQYNQYVYDSDGWKNKGTMCKFLIEEDIEDFTEDEIKEIMKEVDL